MLGELLRKSYYFWKSSFEMGLKFSDFMESHIEFPKLASPEKYFLLKRGILGP